MKSFGEQLKLWRQLRGLSQMELASQLGMSTRNISFLETGRSRATKPTVVRLAQFLNIPCRSRDQLLLSCGIQPNEQGLDFQNKDLEPFYNAITLMLKKHEPYPAFTFNRWWDLLEVNQAASNLFQLAPGQNIIENCILNDDWLTGVQNGDQVIWYFYHEMRNDLLHFQDERFKQLFLRIENKVKTLNLADDDLVTHPALCSCFLAQGINLNLTSIVSRFRVPQTAQLEEIKIELVFPIDAESEAFFTR